MENKNWKLFLFVMHKIGRFYHVFLTYLKDALEYRSKALVYFMYPLVSTTVMLIFWYAASSTHATGGYNFSFFLSYYLWMMLAGSALMCYAEDAIARYGIYRGDLSAQLLRPFSWMTHVLFAEVPWRVMGGVYSVLIMVGVSIFLFPIQHNTTVVGWTLAIIAAALGFTISFLYKFILGSSAFWLTNTRGLTSLSDIIIMLFAGQLMPIRLMPPLFRSIALSLPFSSMVYIPVAALQGTLGTIELLRAIGIQLLWLCLLIPLQQFIWRRGLRVYTGVGQ
ncbi:hypothetical protein C5B42_05615 [Candidatus Cerribacteria bacterium 'Amazon FNV 2010 28 9']|uniref:ABC transporter permease n=1 Tax=Candidatus Cerribacteria bacterium 'Amazon FNV 2010 28 9' TaxID=2081795 RepID=A0A317JPS6_9BACT|nr:MAG: hypothetical protein C5B42_05615 [Candidatus Cerribacteria bacterium 'Amazon FNV 2010 28 9']